MTRVMIAGFQHETNTFAPSRTEYDAFVRGGMFPALSRGAGVLDLRQVNVAAGGFMNAAAAKGMTLVPVVWAGATPAAHVTRDAFERIATEICDAARSHAPDAIYLDLHGAMVCEHLDDGEGELLARLRDIVGAELPIVASLDLHANVTARMLTLANILVAYRTYPHEDMAETGTRVAGLLGELLQGVRLVHSSRRLPFLIPINGMCTLLEPAQSIYHQLGGEEVGEVASLSFAPGFPAADFAECGGLVWGHGTNQAAVDRAVDALYRRIIEAEPSWTISILAPDEAVQTAKRLSATAHGPIVIADTQDNPGVGGDSDTMGMLRALLDNDAQSAAIGLIVDPAAARAAHIAGAGQDIIIELGGKSGVAGDAPLKGIFRVEQLSDGRCRFDGPMLTGKRADVGPSAQLSIGGVRIAVSSLKDQMLDRNLFRMVGIEPDRMAVLVVKSSVHFRADFAPTAGAILVAKAPGPALADPSDIPWTNLGEGMRTCPLGAPFHRSDVHATVKEELI